MEMGLWGMKGNHNFAAGLIWRHERFQMKSLSKPSADSFHRLQIPEKSVPPWRL